MSRKDAAAGPAGAQIRSRHGLARVIIPRVMSTRPLPLSTVVHAPAKINLTLEILGTRADGYHELRSVMLPLALRDDVVLTRQAGQIQTTVTGEGVDLSPLDAGIENLATRAARLMQARYGVSEGVRIEIHKRIPIGGGLGGGSADAAATLVGLNALWALGASRAELAALGGEVGCDVPGLVYGEAVEVAGVGERVTPLMALDEPAPEGFWLVLANPGFAVSTPKIYNECDGILTGAPDTYMNVVSSVREGCVEKAANWLFNGLQAIVFQRYPATAEVASALHEAGSLGVLLSGSGATVFGLAKDESHARQIRLSLSGSLWSAVTKTLPDGVMAAHGPLTP